MKEKDIIEKYHDMKRELSILKFQIARFKGIKPEDVIETINFSHPEGERVQTSGTSDKAGNIALNYKEIAEKENNDWFNYLVSKYKRIDEDIKIFEYGLQTLTYGDVIWDLVVEQMTWDEVERKYNISHATIGRYRTIVIKELDKLYEANCKTREEFNNLN